MALSGNQHTRSDQIGARVIEHAARIRIQLPASFPGARLFRAVALRLGPSGGWAAGLCARCAAERGRSTPTRCTVSEVAIGTAVFER
jgi:hypothetical protein